ncbi:uncharacterized protein LOC144476525 [Augochlora pura]
MDPNSKKYTAFSTPQGHSHYNRMPVGLKNAPATFQRMMDIICEKIEKAYLYSTNVDIYIGLNVEEIFTKVSDLTKFMHIIHKHCKDTCNLKDKLAVIDERHRKLENLNLHLKIMTHSRYRRGLLNAIGTISKSLFGTLDENDLAIVNANLDKLFDDNNKLKTIINNQTALIKKIINSNSLRQLDQLNIEAQSLDQRVTKCELITKLIIKAEGAIYDLHFLLDELLNTITLAKQGIISTQIIDQDTFMKAYGSAIGNEIVNRAITPRKENFQFILDIADLKVFTVHNRIFFKISVPVISDLEWDVTRLYPIPSKKNKVFMIPLIEHQTYFLAGLKYINVDDEYVKQYCKRRSGITMCRQTQPIHDRHTKKDCTSELINFDKEIKVCQIVVLKIEEITFIPLKSSNQFIAIPENPIRIDTICGTKHEVVTLSVPTLLRSNISCDILYNNNYMRIGETRINVSYEIHFKEISTPNDTNYDILLTQLKETPKIVKKINGYQSTIDQLTDQITSLQFSHRVSTVKSLGLTTLQILGYMAFITVTIWIMDKLGLTGCIKNCLPSKLCFHLLSCKIKNNTIDNKTTNNPLPSAPATINISVEPPLRPTNDEEEETIIFQSRNVKFHKSIFKRK